MTWFHFRLIKTCFLFFFFFFVADHLLVGHLCTNPKSDRSLLSCLKVTQCSTSEIRDATVQLMLSTDPTYDNRTIANTLKMKIRTVQRVQGDENKVSGYGYGLWCGFKRGPHHATSHLRSWLESQHQSVPGLKVNIKVYLDVLNSVVIPWCNQVAGGRPWVWQQDSAPAHKSKENQAWLQKECYDFVPSSHWPHSSPDLNLLDYFVWSYVENITNMTSHNTKASLIATIRRVFAELPPALVEKVCSQFQIRIEAVIEAEGGYIE